MKYLSIIVLSIFLLSCNKESSLIEDKSENFMSSTIINTGLGEDHNEYLDLVMQLETFPNHSYEDLYSVAEVHYENIFENSYYDSLGITDSSNFREWLLEVESLESSSQVYNYIRDNDFSDCFNEALDELYGIIYSDSTTMRVGTDRIYLSLGELEELYTEIESSSMSEIEKQGVLGSIEIAYYSMEYWSAVYNNEDNPWYNSIYNNSKAEELKWWQKALKIGAKVGLDAAGFTGGFLLGSGLGSAGGPVAAAGVGGACGTLLGGAASSLIK